MAAKTDANQAAIVLVLRQAGVDVVDLHGVGKNVPDLLCGFRGRNVLLEVKAPKTGRLSAGQRAWHLLWRGQAAVVTTPEEALRAVGLLQP